MRSRGLLFFAALGAGALVLTASLCPRAAVDQDFAQREYVQGIPNFARLTPTLWRGCAPGETGIESLKRMGVRVIVDFRTTDEHGALVEEPNILYVRLPFKASASPPRHVVDTFLRLAGNPATQPLFFHCRHGKDRTGAMAALYRIRVQGWPVEKALGEMKFFGFRMFYRDLLEFVRTQEPPGEAPLTK